MPFQDYEEINVGNLNLAINDDTARYLLFNPRFPCTLFQIGVVMPNIFAVGATNYATVSVINQTGPVTIASFDTNTGGQAFTAGVPIFLDLVSAALPVAAGDRITVQNVDTADGRAIAEVQFIVRYRRLDDAGSLSLG